MRDLRSELEEWNGAYPASWRPRAGETLVGQVKGYTTAESQYGEVAVCTIAEEETGEEVAVWLSSVVLLSLFKRFKPKVGERLGLKYGGTHPEKGYKLYGLVVDRQETLPDFEQLGGEAPAPDASDPFDGEQGQRPEPVEGVTFGQALRAKAAVGRNDLVK